jgi:hypothetical protein
MVLITLPLTNAPIISSVIHSCVPPWELNLQHIHLRKPTQRLPPLLHLPAEIPSPLLLQFRPQLLKITLKQHIDNNDEYPLQPKQLRTKERHHSHEPPLLRLNVSRKLLSHPPHPLFNSTLPSPRHTRPAAPPQTSRPARPSPSCSHPG